MKFHALACALVLGAAAPNVSAFAPVAVTQPRAFVGRATAAAGVRPVAFTSAVASQSAATFGLTSSSSSAVALRLKAGGGPEALDEYVESMESLAPVSSKLKNPKLAKLAAFTAVPASWMVGAAMTPSRRLAARAVGGLVAAAAGGMLGKEAIEEDVRKAAPAAIARRLSNLGLDDPNVADGIAILKSDYGLDDEDFGNALTAVYAVYLKGMAKNPVTRTAELKEMSALRRALGLTNQQVGQAHADAATSFYRETTRFTTKEELEDEDHPDRMSIDKLLFLTERALRQGNESDNAFVFEMSRVARALSGADEQDKYKSKDEGWNDESNPDMDRDGRRAMARFLVYGEEEVVVPPMTVMGAMDRVRSVSSPFYVRALESTRAKLDSGDVTEELLSKARATLGVDEHTRKEVHIECFVRELRSLLGLKEEEEDDDEYFGGDVDMALGDSESANLPMWMVERDAKATFDQDAELKKIEEERKKREGDTSGIKFTEGSFDRLSKLQDILKIEDKEASFEITTQVSQYWFTTALQTLESAIAGSITPADAWATMHARQKELLLPMSNMKDMMYSLIMQIMGRPLEKTSGFAKVKNAGATHESLSEAILAKGVCKAVCHEAGWTEFEDFEKVCFDPLDQQSACGFINRNERQNMYSLFLTRSVNTQDDGSRNLSEDDFDKLSELRSMLGISEEEGAMEIKKYFGPELQSVMTNAVAEISNGDVSDKLMKNMRGMIDNVIESFRLEEEMVKMYSGPLYAKAANQIAAESPGGIPTKDQNDTLAKLREILDIPKEQTYGVHLQCFGSSYKKGLLEALGSTGVVREEFRKPLEDLRDRLGVSEEDSKVVFYDAMSDRMKPMIEYISTEMERLVLTQDQLAQKRGADYGEDFFKDGGTGSGSLGMGTEGNIMGDIMNLVDFYVENDIVQKEQVGTKTVENKVPAKEEGGEEQTVSEEVPVYESTYPITGLGLQCLSQKVAELCYRQFLVGSFTEQGTSSARYEAAKGTFGGILGLSAQAMEAVGSDIGGMVYDNFITQAMSNKGSLDQQDMMFLANIQSKLGISAEQGERMLLGTQAKLLSDEAVALLDRGSTPSPEAVKAFREKCDSLGLDLETDVGLGKRRLQSMFSFEITPGLDDGTITGDDGDLLAEIQESLGLSEEEGEEVVAGIINKRAMMLFGEARSCMLRGFEALAAEKLQVMARYAEFVDGDLDLEPSEEDAVTLYNLLNNSDFGDLNAETVEKRKGVVKRVLFS